MITMKKFGLIGCPISHSKSPDLFKAAYGGRYEYNLIEGEDFDASYQKFLEEYQAINVTAPFKEPAYHKADSPTPRAKATESANILYKDKNGNIVADNSDIDGVEGAVSIGASDKDIVRTALVVGCGGAGRSAAYHIASAGFKTIILNRNLARAEKYASKLKSEYGYDITAGSLEEFRKWFRKAGVIIYTLPTAIEAIRSLKARDIKGRALFGKMKKIVMEANYKDPAFTPELIENLQKTNPYIKYVDGKSWLLYQAIAAYKRFTNEVPDIEKMHSVL